MSAAQSPVFIVGCGRSGTTLLRLMLSSSPNLMIPPESDFLWRSSCRFGPQARLAADEFPSFVEYIQRISSFGGLELDRRELLAALSAEPSRLLADCVAVVYAEYARKHGRNRWGDKNPFYVLRLNLIKTLYPDARIVHVIRDGRDVAMSYNKTKMRPYNLFMTAGRWVRCVDAGRAWAAHHPNAYLEVRYEHLVDNPEAQLRRVCTFIEEDFTPAMMDYYQQNDGLQQIPASDRGHHLNLAKPIMQGNHGKWRTEMSPSDRYVFEAVGGTTLKDLGYEVSVVRRSPALDLYVASCRLRHLLGCTGPVRSLLDVTHWRAKRLIRNMFLIDNEHYRDQDDGLSRSTHRSGKTGAPRSCKVPHGAGVP